jgi:hypothetical protein
VGPYDRTPAPCLASATPHAPLRTRLGDGGDGVTDTAGTTESRAALKVAAIGWSSSAVPSPELTRGRRRARSWPCRTRTVNTLWMQALPWYRAAAAVTPPAHVHHMTLLSLSKASGRTHTRSPRGAKAQVGHKSQLVCHSQRLTLNAMLVGSLDGGCARRSAASASSPRPWRVREAVGCLCLFS